MNRLPLILSSIAVAILAGCATESRVTSAPAPVAVAPAVVAAPAAAPLRAGMGRIESIMAVPTAAGGRTESNSTKRIVMKMDDGSMQYFDTEAAGLAAGDRIEITKEGNMRHPA
jgi:hypothetical protein